MLKKMDLNLNELLNLYLMAVFVAFVSVIAYLQLKSRNAKKKGIQYYQPENLWNVIKVVYGYFKWSGNKSPEKRPPLEHLYRSKLLDHGRPKFYKLFNRELLIADDSDTINDMMHSKECNAVFPPSFANILTNGHGHSTGLMWTNGPHWKELRKYEVKKLGQLGFNKNDQLSLLLSELLLDFMSNLSNIKSTTRNKIPVKDLFVLPTLNIVWCMVGGHKFPPGDKDFATLYKTVDIMGHTSMWKIFLMSILPNNKTIHYLLGCKPFSDGIQTNNEFLKKFVDEKEKLANNEPKDFVDHFLLEIEKHKDNPDLKNYYCKNQLVQILSELFIGGTDTSSKFMEFSLMYMAQHPEVQEKVQMEIDTVIGSSCLPSYSDHRKCMPYTSATIMEIHRMTSIIQLLPKRTETDWENKGRILKKGTQIMCVLWAPRMNESYWGDPATFRPKRFLNEDNSLIMEKMNRVMPFGSGIRLCPGENIATASIFTFFVGILQKYTVTEADKDERLAINTCVGLVNEPIPFHVSLFDRLKI